MHRLKKFLALVLVFTLVLPYCSGFDLLINAFAVDDIVEATDERLTYYGRWTESDEGYMTSGWGTSKVRFKLTDTNTFTVHSTADSYTDLSLMVSTDDTTFKSVLPDASTGDYTFTLEGEAPYEVLLLTKNSTSKKGIVTITGITPGSGGTISKTENDKKVVEIVGDSISDDWLTDTNNDGIASSSAYIAQAMGWEAVNVAAAGITLTDRTNNSLASPYGMETMYFRANNTGTDTTEWSFPAEQEPDYIMLHIGTNDRYFGVSGTSFQQTYVKFLRNIRLKNPNATILCLSPYGGKFNGTFDYPMDDEIKAAVNEIHTQYYDYNVFYIASTGLITEDNFSDYFAGTDVLHPAEASFEAIAEYVTPLLTAAVEQAHVNTSNPYSTLVMSQKGFKASELATYKGWLENLSETDNEGAYARLTNAIEKLETEGYSYYDDFLVFGDYVSDMDDTKLEAGDYFVATTNTTNYNYMFGGAHAAHFGATVTAANVSELFMPSFHFATLDGESGKYFQHTNVMDSSVENINCALVQGAMSTVTANGYKTGTGASHHFFNKMALNTEALNYYGGLDSFQVTANPLARPVIFYNYIDSENWSAISITTNSGNNAERVGYSNVNCVNGVLDTNSIYCWKNQTTTGILWDITADTDNAATISTTGYLDSDPMTLTFVWSETDNCYKLTIVDDETNTTLLNNVALASTVSTVKKMPNLILSDINNDNSSNQGYLDSNIGILSVSVEFEEHTCVAAETPVADLESTHYSVCALCGVKIEGSDKECSYDVIAHDETYHWKACACGNTDSSQAKELHTSTEERCTVCNYNPQALSAEEAALEIVNSIGFLGAKYSDYAEWLESLESHKSSTEAINSETTATWKEAYTRLENAMAHLDGGKVSYYDDFVVFGTYSSDMDDTNLQPDDIFEASVNTTNYNYMFGGAYAERLTENKTLYYGTATPENTSPTKAENITQLFMPSFHYGYRTGYSYGTYADTSKAPGYSILVQPHSTGAAGTNHHFINKLALNANKLGLATGLDSFTVQVDPTAWPVIFYNYKDANNWSAISIAGSSTDACYPVGYATINCVDGVLDTKSMLVWEHSSFSGTTGRIWNMATDTTNAALISTTSYLDSDPMTLTFNWNGSAYELTIVDDNTGIKLLDNVALTSSLTMEKMPNLILSDIRNNNGSNDEYLSSNIGILAVSATFEEHICSAEDWYSENGTHWQICDGCGNKINEGTCDEIGYDWSETQHWAACSVCHTEVAGAEKVDHTIVDNKCACGYELTAQVVALYAVNAQGFLSTKLADYENWLALMESNKDNESAISDQTTATWAEAYNRLSTAIAKLSAGATYYDDFAVFGTYKSDMTDTGLSADDYFGTTENTTNYEYMFGGAYFSILSGDEAPTAADVTELFMPSFHFGTMKSGYYNYGAENADAPSTSINCALVQHWLSMTDEYPSGSWENHQFFNKLTLDTQEVLGFKSGTKGLDMFEVTIDPTGYPVIFYNYQDANNWSAISVARESSNDVRPVGFSVVNCENGVLDTKTIYCWENSGYSGTTGRLWNTAVDTENAEKISDNTFGDNNQRYLDSDPMTLTFVWDADNRCYKLTILDNVSGIKLVEDNALTSSIAMAKMPNLILSDINNDNRTNDGYKSSNIGILSVTVEFGDEDHVCVAKDGYVHDAENNQHYQVCKTCGVEVADTREECSGTAIEAVDDTHHKLVCATCGNPYGEEIECEAKSNAVYGENGEHWNLCTCGNKVNITACTPKDTYEITDTEHYKLCAVCGEEIPDSRSVHAYTTPETYFEGKKCECGHDDGVTKAHDFNPVILGSQILKASKAEDQKLRIAVDFANAQKLLDDGFTIEEYGVIVVSLDAVLADDNTTVDADKLKGYYGTSNYIPLTNTDLPDENEDGQRLLKITINIPAKNYGKRFAMIAYVKVNGACYYSTGTNTNVGLENGIINTGVMRVMKAILSDTDETTGYNHKIATAANSSFDDQELMGKLKGTYADGAALAAHLEKYLTGEIGTNSGDDYQDAKYIAMYVFYYCKNVAN